MTTVKALADRLGKAIWHSLARIAELLPGPLSRNQVELMEVDTAVASAGMPGFDALGIAPQPIAHALEQDARTSGAYT